jgi:hypothetical protein
MKKIIYLIVLIFNFQLYAQDVALENKNDYNGYERVGKYFKDINGHLNKFIGTWKWQDNPTNPTKVLEINFFKVENYDTGGYFEDRLNSTYIYSENGVEIYNTVNIYDDKFIFGGLFSFPNNINKLRLYYSEPNPATNGFRYNFHIEYLQSATITGTAQLKWDVEIVIEVAQVAELPKIPMHIILTKQ